MASGLPSIPILGCRVDAIDRVSAVECIAQLANANSASVVITLGVEMIMAAQHDAFFRTIVNAAALNVCDTIGLLLASRLRRGPLRERVTGVELVADLAARSATHADVRLYLLGAGGDTAERAANVLRQRFPGARICGVRDGYFQAEQSIDVAAVIAASGANVLCAGLGAQSKSYGLQNIWLLPAAESESVSAVRSTSSPAW